MSTGSESKEPTKGSEKVATSSTRPESGANKHAAEGFDGDQGANSGKSFITKALPFVVFACLILSLLLFIPSNARGSIGDRVILYGLIGLILSLGVILLLLAAQSKLLLEADGQKRKERESVSDEKNKELERDDPLFNATQRRRQQRIHLLCHELGVALCVTGLVTALFEGTIRLREHEQREKEQKAIQEDVFQGVFGHSIDHSIIKEVLTGVLQAPIQREDLDVDFHFCCTDETKKYLQVHVTVDRKSVV